MSEETKNLNHTDQKKGEDALKGLSMKERKKALEEKKEKRRTKLYIAIGVVVVLLLDLFMKKTYLGQSIRATSDDKTAAALMGVNVKRTYGIAMGIAMGTAALAGLCVGMPWSFYPTTGSQYLIIAFGVVVIGGMGSIKGTLIAGLIFGLAQVLGGANYGMLASYAVLLIMLIFRPQGLFSK